MLGHHDFNIHFVGAPQGRLEVVNFEPQQYAVPIRPVVAICDRTVMMFNLKAVQLKDQLPV